MARSHPETISPTAHYTGYVWYAHGHSHAAFATPAGRTMYRVLRGANVAALAVGLPTFEGMLLARHRLIDLRLQQAIDTGEISQVVEIAAGLSPRGWRFRTRYGDRLTYVEADLPGMIERKRNILAQLGGESPHHYTAKIDALVDTGPTSIDAICGALDPMRGTAIITEGLINYFDRERVIGMWQRFARALRRFPSGRYLSDIILTTANRGMLTASFSVLLSAFVRSRVHMHFDSSAAVEAELSRAGFDAAVLDPRKFSHELPDLEMRGAGRVRVIDAKTRSDRVV